MKIELALAAVVAAGLGAVGATVAVGLGVKEPTVVADPYETGLRHAEAVAARRGADPAPGAEARVEAECDLGAGPCARSAGPYLVTLDLQPRPLRTMSDLAAVVAVQRAGVSVAGAEVALSFDMRGMAMGANRRVLSAAGEGRYLGRAVLVRCPSGRKDWVATVAVGAPGSAPAATTFDFRVVE